MKKAFLFLFLTIQMLGCKEDLVHEGKLSNEAETLNPKIKEILSLPLIESVAETNGRITGCFKDGREIVYANPNPKKFELIDSVKFVPNAGTSARWTLAITVFDKPSSVAN